MGYTLGLPSCKLSDKPSQQKKSKGKTGLAIKYYKEALKERQGQDKDIKHELTKNNIYLVQDKNGNNIDSAETLQKISDDTIAAINAERAENGERKLRFDTITMCATIIKPPMAFMETLTAEQQIQFLQDSFDVFKEIINFKDKNGDDVDNIRSAVIHLDESVPHLHIFWQPFTKDKNSGEVKLCGKEAHNEPYLGRLNREMPKGLREKGWSQIDDCHAYDPLEEEALKKELGEEKYQEFCKKRNASKGRSSKKFKADMDKQVALAEMKLDDLNKEISEAEAQKETALTKINSEKETAESELEEVKKKVSSAQSELTEIENNKATAQTELDSVLDDKAIAEIELEDLQSDYSKLKKSLDTAANDIQNIELAEPKPVVEPLPDNASEEEQKQYRKKNKKPLRELERWNNQYGDIEKAQQALIAVSMRSEELNRKETEHKRKSAALSLSEQKLQEDRKAFENEKAAERKALADDRTALDEERKEMKRTIISESRRIAKQIIKNVISKLPKHLQNTIAEAVMNEHRYAVQREMLDKKRRQQAENEIEKENKNEKIYSKDR